MNLLNKYLLRSYYMLGVVFSIRDRVVNKRGKFQFFGNLYLSGRDRNNNNKLYSILDGGICVKKYKVGSGSRLGCGMGIVM